MAEGDEEVKEGKKESTPTKKSPIVLILVVFLVSLILGGGGVFIGLKVLSPSDDAPQASKEENAEKEKKANETVGAILPLDTFIVNLADNEETRYLKITVEVELESPDVSKELNQKMPRIRDSLLILLSSKDFKSIQTVEGKFKLRDEIIHRINTVLRTGSVKTAYFTDLVVQ